MPIHVVIARDPLIAEEGARARIPDGVPTQRWWGFELDIEGINGQLGSIDLFSSAKACHWVNFLDYKPRKADSGRLMQLLQRLPAEITLVCSHAIEAMTRGEEERLLKGADYLRIANGAQVDDLRRLSDGDSAVRWLRTRARDVHGLILSPGQVERLLSLSSGRLSLADGELQKLALMKSVSQAQQIPDGVFDAAVSVNPAARFYDLIEAILNGVPAAQRLLLDWHLMEPEGFRLISELRRHFLGIYTLSRGERVLPPFFATQLQRHARHWQGRRLAYAVELMAELEFGMKSGAFPGQSSREAELGALQVAIAQLTAA